MMRENEDPSQWHGAHIVGEQELSFASDVKAKKRTRKRQNSIFSVMAVLVLVAFVGASLIHLGILNFGGSTQPVQASEPSSIEIKNEKCPEIAFSYQDPGSFAIRVLNTTSISGLAGNTAKALEKRGFKISSTTSGMNSYADESAVVIAGSLGYAQAMTVQRQVPGAKFVYDKDMYGTQVDLAVGTKFDALAKERKIDTSPGKLDCAAPKG